MRKIRCPQCAVINLEGFITFPNCAGCGMRLPELPPHQEKAWRRPLRTALWTTFIGGLVTFLAMLTIKTLEPPTVEAPSVFLTARRARDAQVGHPVSLSLGMELSGAPPGRQDEHRALKLRVPREFFREFSFVSLEPAPDSNETRGGGRYFFYDKIASGTHLRFSLMPLRAGRFNMKVRLYAKNQIQNECLIVLHVAPRRGDVGPDATR